MRRSMDLVAASPSWAALIGQDDHHYATVTLTLHDSWQCWVNTISTAAQGISQDNHVQIHRVDM